MAVNRVGTPSINSGSAVAGTIFCNTTVPSGQTNLTAYIYIWISGEGVVSSIADFGGVTPQLLGDYNDSLHIYRVLSPASGPTSASLVKSVDGLYYIAVVYYNDVNQADPDDPPVGNSNTELLSIDSTPIPIAAGGMVSAAGLAVGFPLQPASGTSAAITQDQIDGSVVSGIIVDKTGSSPVTLGFTMTDTFGDNLIFAFAINPAGGGGSAPTITNVDTDNIITSTQTNWIITGTNYSSAAVAITQGSVTVSQSIDSQNATTIQCDTVFDAGATDLKYGAATLRVTNADTQFASQAITINPPTGRSYVNLSTPNTTAANRITAIPDLASGDQLEISNVVGGTIADVTVATDATFSCADTVTSFGVRSWAANDSTWGAAGTQTVGDDTAPDPFIFTTQSSVARGVTVTSNTITIAGLGAAVSVAVSVAGSAGSQYQKNGGAWVSTAGTAVNGDTFAVRHTSGAGYLATTTTTLTVGDTAGTFSATTLSNTAPVFEGPAIADFTLTRNVAMTPRSYVGRWVDGDLLTYTLQGGAVTGLTLSSAGVLSGTPTVNGTYSGRMVRASDGSLTANSNTFTITVSDAPPPYTGSGIEGPGIEGPGYAGM